MEVSLAENFSLLDDNDREEEEDELQRFTEDGVPIEPFNMRAERNSGYFDADGNYIEFREQEDTDAWLETLPGKFGPGTEDP